MTPRSQAFHFLPFGAIKPSGWIRARMAHDLEHGFVGHLDELVPDLILRDDIYGADRLTKTAKTKELGGLPKKANGKCNSCGGTVKPNPIAWME